MKQLSGIRRICDKMSRGRDLFTKIKPILNAISRMYHIFPLSVRKRIFENKRYSKGLYGIGIRYVLLKSIAKHCGDNVLINQGCFILKPENISIGNNVSIHPMCYIDATGGVEIGKDVSLAHGVTIMSTTHNYADKNAPIKDQGVTSYATVVGDDVWVGAKATILAGISVDDHSIIGAGAVVTHNVSANSIVGGVPAKKIKDR